jgi:hypothetical protein
MEMSNIAVLFVILIVILTLAFVAWRWIAIKRRVDARLGSVKANLAQKAEQEAAANYLLSAGTPATAKILSADTGGRLVIVHGKHECRIGLKVQVPDRQPYDVQIQQLVEPIRKGALQLGATVEVRVDPANPNNVVIDFSKPILPAGAA